jgi:hypothetical protein
MLNTTAATHEPVVPGMTPGWAQEIYEQLLSLADRIGAAYVEAYQKITVGLGEAQDSLFGGSQSEWLRYVPAPLASPGGISPAERLASPARGDWADPAERARELSDALLDMSTRIGLAYVNAHEQAALAAADCREALAAGSPSQLVKTIASARADLVREIARTCASTAREMVD